MNWQIINRNCNKGKHRLRDNRYGVTWCIDCGRLSTKPSGKQLTHIKLRLLSGEIINKSVNMFDIQLYNDGRPSIYGNVEGADLEEAVEELIYYNIVSENYTEEEVSEKLINMEIGYGKRIQFGTGLIEIYVNKTK